MPGNLKSESVPWRVHLVMLALVLGLVVLFFHRALFTDQVFFNADISGHFLPWRYFVHRWADRALPFWCPLMYSGFPLLAEGEIGGFYPLNFLFYTGLSPAQAHKYVTVLHYLLAGLFTYLYAVSLRFRPLAALLAAVIFTFSGFLVTHLVHPNLLQAAVWLPLILLCLERAWNQRKPGYGLAGGAVWAVQLLAGHLQISFYTALAAGLYLLVAALSREPPEPGWRRWGRGILTGMGGLVTGSLLAAIQLLPTWELTALSDRVNRSYDYLTQHSLSIGHLILLLFPNWFGRPVDGTYAGPWNFWEVCGFVGILPLLLSGVAALRQTRQRIPCFFTLLALLSLFLALGGHNPFYRWLVEAPGFNLFRCPARFLYLFSFSVALLAGLGLNEFLERAIQPPRYLVPGLLGLVVVELFHFGMGLNPVIAPEFYEATPATVRFLKQEPGLLRIYGRGVLWGAASLIYGIPTIDGYVALHLLRYEELMYLLDRSLDSSDRAEQLVGAKLLGMLCGQYVVTAGRLPDPPFERAYDREGVRIFRHRGVQPRATLARKVLLATGRAQAFAWLQQPEFDPQSQVILEEKPEVVPTSDPLPTAVPPERASGGETVHPASEKAVISRAGSTHITLSTVTVRPAFLVLHDQYYPGWKAFVDGVETKVYRANYVLRAIWLPAGRHTVEWVFEPTSYRWGRNLSLATLGGLGFLLLIHVGVRRRKRRSPLGPE